MIVEIVGVQQSIQNVSDDDSSMVEAAELNGSKGQVLEFSRDCKKWKVETYCGVRVLLEEKQFRPLRADELNDYDFVFGPRSDPDLFGQSLAECVGEKGYAVVKIFVGDKHRNDAFAVAKRLEDDDKFSRLAEEFEPGYLGKECTAKVSHVDMAAGACPDYVAESYLKTYDDTLSAMMSMLRLHSENQLGFSAWSRTNLLVSLPLTGDDEDLYPAAEVEDNDAEQFLHLMHRKKLSLIEFVGPAAGSLTLLPKRPGAEEVELKAEPGTLLVLLANRFDYSYEPGPESMTLSTFVLDAPTNYSLDRVMGSVDSLSVGVGPPMPKSDTTVHSIYCRYGGSSDGRGQLWTGVCKASVDGLTEVPQTRWDHSQYFDPDHVQGGSYTRHGCFGIDGVELFDCRFFEISPMEAKGMDPVQRQVLEVSYVALLEAGWDKKSLARKGENIGHFVGIDKDDWMFMASDLVDTGGSFGASAACNAITANRFSFSLNLKGASMTCDTACSSSLVCTHVAKYHLRNSEHDPMPGAIVHGINLMLSPGPFVGCCGANMLSHEGRSFTFNASADGYARGECSGAMCLKQERYDSEKAFCVLAGSQANQDGRSASMTAPNGPAQERCMQAVLRESGLAAAEIDCIECHGTGTALGDPIEVGSFRKVMSKGKREEPLITTSSKSNIAHAEGGAGLAGFIKCCLQVMQCEGASNCHLKVLNPHLDFAGFPCQVLSQNVMMRGDSAVTGVSSFGFGGTNAHAEAWGRNVMNSRSIAAQDPKAVFQKKLQNSPPAEITMSGDDWEDWETTGIDPGAEPGTLYKVILEDDGTARWEKDDAYETEPQGEEFYIQGTHSNWDPVALERHATIPDLWTGTIELGSSGQEQFQIVADENQNMVYRPNSEMCTLKASPMAGPSSADREHAWLVRGSPGDSFRVEFFLQGRSKSILWVKE